MCPLCCEFVELALEILAKLGRGSVGGRSSCAPQCSNLEGFAGTRDPTKFATKSMITCREVGLGIYGYLFIHIQRLWFDF